MKVRNVKMVIQSHIWDWKLTFPESPKPIQSSQPQDLGREVYRDSFSRLHYDIHVMCSTRLGTKRWLKLANSQKYFVFMLFLSFWKSQYTQFPVLQHLNFCSKTSDAKKSEFFAQENTKYDKYQIWDLSTKSHVVNCDCFTIFWFWYCKTLFLLETLNIFVIFLFLTGRGLIFSREWP